MSKQDRDLSKLHPEFRRRLMLAFDRYRRLYGTDDPPFVTEGYRSPERQTELYAIGRTKPGRKVTNARAGESIHQYGLAADIAFTYSLYSDLEKFINFGRIAEGVGLISGAFWTGGFTDNPHIQADITAHDAKEGKEPRWGKIKIFDQTNQHIDRVFVIHDGEQEELDVDVINKVGNKLYIKLLS